MKDSEFSYEVGADPVTPSMQEAYKKNGYVIIRNVLNETETRKLRRTMECEGIQKHAYITADGEARQSGLVIWFTVDNDVPSAVASSEKVAGVMERLMGDEEVYHFSSKLIMKHPGSRGAFTWHQDYGYFYTWGYIYPDSASVFIALDECTKETGCLQVIKGSHHLGRINHFVAGKMLQADPEIVTEAKKRLEVVDVEMKPGDAIYFSGNLLHCSLPNVSNKPRWSYVIAYNQRHNQTYMKPGHPLYTPHPGYIPLLKVPDSTILTCEENFDMDKKWFLKGEEDLSRDSDAVRAVEKEQ